MTGMHRTMWNGARLAAGLTVLLLAACGGGGGSWEARLNRCLETPEKVTEYPEFSVVLRDMEKHTTAGAPEYYHRYQLIYGTGSDPQHLEYHEYLGDWQQVPAARYTANEKNLGMVLVSKKGTEIVRAPQPPGYQYVGDSRYGEWKQDSGGNSFWSFYGKYMFFSSMFNMMTGPVYRSNWDYCSRGWGTGRPCYGSGGTFGTGGAYVRSHGAYRDFKTRQTLSPRARRSSFESKVARRVSRSRMSPVRSRSGGFGK